MKDECPPNEEYLLCGSACPFNCSDPGPVSCSQDCVEGCFCKSGFLRNDTGVCVNADECIGACARTCADPEPTACGLACSMGCFCKAGFVRDEKTKKCVTLDQCPAEQCLNKNEVYDICLASCEPSCDNPSPFCAKICTGGCVCAPGLLRNSDGECVSVDKCPSVGNGTDPGLLTQYMDVINKILNLSNAKEIK
ncbi:hypothetical protein MSG28_013453 [Choristoneura fumiferana]|uniref:Uncharacterized protein n=1 Tax=Choristoneura fumiferana TaxID=7141 RepID=A0ACC0KT36_CHOFU|nr:hypothetical protein MSG28_013453 [Choristoneura fumiferana]